MSGIPMIKLLKNFDHIEKFRMAAVTIWDIIKNNISRKVDFIFLFDNCFLWILMFDTPYTQGVFTFYVQRVLSLYKVYLLYITSTDAMQWVLSIYNEYLYIQWVLTIYNEYVLHTASIYYVQRLLLHTTRQIYY